MKTAQQLRDSWDRNADLREGLRRLVESPEWAAASALVVAEATRDARVWKRDDADPVLARNLSHLSGVIGGIFAIQNLTKDPSEPVNPLQEYDDEYVKKIQERKLTEQ